MAPRSEPFIIVTGPGRSGTSAVARVLHESGVRMGDHLGPASEFNPVGFYEELPVCELNEQIMADCGMEGVELWPSRETMRSAAVPYQRQMAEIVASTTARGWKDPRLCLTLEAWLPHLGGKPKMVLCLRSPDAFIQSVISIFGLSRREALESWWANHLRRALDVARDYELEVTSVVYEELVAEPAAAVAALASFVGHELDARFIEPELRRFDASVPKHLAPLYEEVRALSRR